MYAMGQPGQFWREMHRIEKMPPESRRKWFHLRCAICGSYRVRFQAAYDEEAGEAKLVFHCGGCHREESFGSIEGGN